LNSKAWAGARWWRISTVVEFASAEALAAWRDHPDHRKAQQRGRNDFYAEYEIINCTLLHRYG